MIEYGISVTSFNGGKELFSGSHLKVEMPFTFCTMLVRKRQIV